MKGEFCYHLNWVDSIRKDISVKRFKVDRFLGVGHLGRKWKKILKGHLGRKLKGFFRLGQVKLGWAKNVVFVT